MSYVLWVKLYKQSSFHSSFIFCDSVGGPLALHISKLQNVKSGMLVALFLINSK